jgi:hypothetical protein
MQKNVKSIPQGVGGEGKREVKVEGAAGETIKEKI